MPETLWITFFQAALTVMLVSQFKSLGIKTSGSGPVSAASSLTIPLLISFSLCLGDASTRLTIKHVSEASYKTGCISHLGLAIMLTFICSKHRGQDVGWSYRKAERVGGFCFQVQPCTSLT